MGLFDPKPRNDNSDLASKVEALTKSVGDMQGGITQITDAVKTMYSTQQTMQQNFDQFQQGAQGNDAQYQSVATEEKFRSLAEYQPEELEGMTETQKLMVMQEGTQKMITDALGGALKPVTDQFNSFQQQTEKDKAQQQLNSVMGETGSDGKLLRPDFNDMLQTMVDLKNDPSMSSLPFDKLYTLAQGEYKLKQPEKYAALQDKHFPKPENMQSSYGGFLSDTLQETGESGDLSIEAASKEAAQEALEEFGSLPDGGGDFAA